MSFQISYSECDTLPLFGVPKFFPVGGEDGHARTPFIAMKKTLITLLALAGVASATPSEWTCDPATEENNTVLVSGTSVHTWDVSSTAGLTWTGGNAFSIAFTLDVTSLDSMKKYAVMSIHSHDSTEDATPGFEDFNGLTSVAIQNGNVEYIFWTGATGQPATYTKALTDLNAKYSLTFVVNRSTGNDMTLDVYTDGNFDRKATLSGKTSWSFGDHDFTELNFGGTTVDYFGNPVNRIPGNADAAQFTLTGAAYMTGGVATADQLKTYYYQLVPEPTTACLSLLALAGLAARRRR